MLSDAKFSHDEFIARVKAFAQEVANRVPGSKVALRRESSFNYVDAYIITVNNDQRDQHTQLALMSSGHVEMTNILGHI